MMTPNNPYKTHLFKSHYNMSKKRQKKTLTNLFLEHLGYYKIFSASLDRSLQKRPINLEKEPLTYHSVKTNLSGHIENQWWASQI